MKSTAVIRRELGLPWAAALALVLVASQSLAKPPAANPSDPAVISAGLKEQGDKAMVELQYADALDYYTRAFEVNPSPALRYNRGRAYEALARYPEALQEMLIFRDTAEAELKAKVPRLEELIAALEQRVTTLTIDCNVRGARILLRGVEVGRAPLGEPLKVNAGSAVLEILADGYLSYRTSLELDGGTELELAPKLQLKSTKGVLTIKANAPGSIVYVDGKRAGVAPVQVELGAGRHAVRVWHDDYEEATTSAVIAAGTRTSLAIDLDAKPRLVERWWFWTAAGAVLAGGTALTVALLTERSPESGDLQPGQIAAPLSGRW